MAPDVVRLAPVMKAHPQDAIGSRAGAQFAMMTANLLGERPCLPPFHSRRGHRYPVNGTALHRDIPADLLEAFTTEHLNSAGNVLKAREGMVVGVSIRPIEIL